MKNLEIRRLRPEEMDHWFKMRIESLNDSPSAFLASPEIELAQGVEFFRSRIKDGGDDNIIFACFDSEQIVGSVGLYRESPPKARHKATIWGMYVRPEYRRRAVGKRLLHAAIEFGRDSLKLRKIDLSVESSREAAKKLYISLGFQTWGHEEMAMNINGQYFAEDYMSLVF